MAQDIDFRPRINVPSFQGSGSDTTANLFGPGLQAFQQGQDRGLALQKLRKRRRISQLVNELSQQENNPDPMKLAELKGLIATEEEGTKQLARNLFEPKENPEIAAFESVTEREKFDALQASRKASEERSKQNQSRLTSNFKQSAITRESQAFKKFPVVASAIERLSAVKDIQNLTRENPAGVRGFLDRAKLQLSGERGGRYTDKDLVTVTGSPAAADRVKRWVKSLKDGKLTEKDIADTLEITEIIKKAELQRLKRLTADRSKNLAKRYRDFDFSQEDWTNELIGDIEGSLGLQDSGVDGGQYVPGQTINVPGVGEAVIEEVMD